MKTKYGALYNGNHNTWSVIGQEDGDPTWFVYVPDSGTAETTHLLVEALNEFGGP